MRNRCSIYYDIVNGVTPLSHVYVRLSVHRARTQASSSGHPLCSADGGTRTWTDLPTRKIANVHVYVYAVFTHSIPSLDTVPRN